MSATETKQMEMINATATLNLKVQPATLTIAGELMTYNAHDTVTLEVSAPQGINPAILLMDVIVHIVDGPKKGTFKPFHKTILENAAQYKQVQLRYGHGDTLIIDVDTQG